ncbi:hypothetical protein [Alteromonas sp. AMM-1]|uniref:hypothetical protein n=1 Tax=Alteromonas sp. AMM-1 TaxID=3394233 RepID=UPI0039A70298
MKRYVAVIRLGMLVLLGLLSIKMMYDTPISSETQSVIAQSIETLACPTGKYAKPYFTISGSPTEFYVMKEFVNRTGCNNEPNRLIGKKPSFTYFDNAEGESKVVQISIGARVIYSKSEFVGKSQSTGAILFFAVIGYSIFLFVAGKKV